VTDLAYDLSVDSDLRTADPLYDSAHEIFEPLPGLFGHKGFLGRDGKPASIAINEDIGETNLCKSLSVCIQNGIQTANVSEIAIDVSGHLAQLIVSRTAVLNVRQAGSAVAHLAIGFNVLELIRQNAPDRVGIMPLQAVRPILLKLKQRALVLHLSGWTSSRKSQLTNQQDEPTNMFHT
jgi:hypothetical protein